MARSARLLLTSLLALAGCSEFRACGSSGQAPVQAAGQASESVAEPAPEPSVAPDDAPRAPRAREAARTGPEFRYARRWLVILHSSATPGEGSEALVALARTGLRAAPQRLSTNAFRELRPCLELVVAAAFEGRAEAVDFQKRLAAEGVDAYVKNAGPLEPDREGRELSCRSGADALARRIEGLRQRTAPRFVESHAGRTFLLLGESSESRVLEPVDAHGSVWMAAVEADPTGLFTVGDEVDVYGARGPLREGCAVKGFAWINRGVAHFGYFQQRQAPVSPGCGRAWAFAELDCEVEPDTLAFALPAGAKAPVFFAEAGALAPEDLDAQRDALRRSPPFRALREEGAVQAEQVQERLREEVRSFGYAQGERQVLFTVAHLRAGEGNSVCGMDYDRQVTRAVVREPGPVERVLPFGALDGDAVEGVLDLEGDGQVELLLRETWPAETVRLVREDGTEVAGAVVENCDCGC